MFLVCFQACRILPPYSRSSGPYTTVTQAQVARIFMKVILIPRATSTAVFRRRKAKASTATKHMYVNTIVQRASPVFRCYDTSDKVFHRSRLRASASACPPSVRRTPVTNSASVRTGGRFWEWRKMEMADHRAKREDKAWGRKGKGQTRWKDPEQC